MAVLECRQLIENVEASRMSTKGKACGPSVTSSKLLGIRLRYSYFRSHISAPTRRYSTTNSNYFALLAYSTKGTGVQSKSTKLNTNLPPFKSDIAKHFLPGPKKTSIYRRDTPTATKKSMVDRVRQRAEQTAAPNRETAAMLEAVSGTDARKVLFALCREDERVRRRAVDLLQKMPRTDVCANFKEKFDVNRNAPDACRYHPGQYDGIPQSIPYPE